MVGWWPGDGDATDIIGGNNGTLVNGTGFTPGKVGQAFKLDGTNNYVQIPDSAALKPTNVTVEAWVKFDSLVTPGEQPGWQPIVYKQSNKNDPFLDGAYALILRNRTGNELFAFEVCGPSPASAIATASTVVTTGQFYHVVGTYDQTAARIYVNGVLEAFNPGVPCCFPLDYSNKPLFIGSTGESTFTNKFAGEIDEVSIYNRALSASEVATLYATGSVGKCKTLPYITSPPQSQTGYWGQSATFSVVATTNYPSLTYQWMSNGVPVLDATNQNLVLTNLQNSFAAGYSVVVSNPNGSVTSAPPANLTIAAAQTTLILYPVLLFNGVVGYTYGIQSSTNLADSNSWIGLTNITLSVSNAVWYDYAPSLYPKKFYRVLQGPIPIP
jgi:hypothetical protein